MGGGLVPIRWAGHADLDCSALLNLLLCLTCYSYYFTGRVDNIFYYYFAGNGQGRHRDFGRNPGFPASLCLDGVGFGVGRDRSFMVGINLAVHPEGCSARSVVYEENI